MMLHSLRNANSPWLEIKIPRRRKLPCAISAIHCYYSFSAHSQRAAPTQKRFSFFTLSQSFTEE
jgi:hypothetical protein